MFRPQVISTISQHTDYVRTLCFSPTQQNMLCSAGRDQKVMLTNLENNETIKTLTGHKGTISGSSFSFDGNLLSTSSFDNSVRVWNLEKQNSDCIELKGHSHWVWDVKFFHNDSSKIVSGSMDKTMRIWDIQRSTGTEICTFQDCGGVLCLDLLPDNHTIISGDRNHKLRFFDVRSGKCEKIIDNHKDWVFSIHFNPLTNCLASGSGDQTVKIIDLRTYNLLHNFEEHSHWVLSLCFRPNSGKYLVSGSADKTLKLYDLEETKKKVVYTLQGHENNVNCVSFSQFGEFFASGSSDQKVFLWNFIRRPSNNKRLEESEEEEEPISFVEMLKSTISESIRFEESNNIEEYIFSSPTPKLLSENQNISIPQTKTRSDSFLKDFENGESLILDPSLHFRNRFFVGINQKIDEIIFHDSGREKEFKDFQIRQKEQIPDYFFETIVSDPLNDQNLKTFLHTIRSQFYERWKERQRNIKKNHQKLSSEEFQFFEELIRKVSNFFGGSLTPQNNVQEKCEEKIKMLKEMKKKNNQPVNMIYLGELKGNGICRHRSILFKLVCDVLGIRCRLLRGWFRRENSSEKYSHCWNMIQLGGQFFIVDVMLKLKIFPEIDSESYISLGGPAIEVSKEKKTLELIERDYLSNRELVKAGSFASVYEVEVDLVDTYKNEEEYTTKKEVVAVKEMNVTELSTRTRTDFWKYCERELTFLKFLNHPNIIHFWGSFRRSMTQKRTKLKQEYLCLVMEFFDRTCYTFKLELEKVQEDDNFTFYHKLVELFVFLIEVCKGLRYMHSVGVIHFDLHPDNILVQWDEKRKQIKKVVITDFGGAKEKEASFRTSIPAGAPMFTAPEILELRMKAVRDERNNKKKNLQELEFTEKSDIYSFGKVMEIFNSFLEGFPEIMNLQRECLKKNPKDRPSLEKMIYRFKNRLRYVNEELKKLFFEKERKSKEREMEEEHEGEIE